LTTTTHKCYKENMSEKSGTVTIRLTPEELAALERSVAEQKKKLPGHDVTKADLIRAALIAQSYIPRPRS